MFSRESVRGLADHFQSLVHDRARCDASTLARHQSFIASHLLCGLLAICAFPVYLVVVGKPSLLGAVVFPWLLSPIAIAAYLSRRGRLAPAHLISSTSFAGLITYCAWLTGGLSSALLPWLVVVPLQAGLSTDRRIVAWAVATAGLGLLLLAASSSAGFPPPPVTTPMTASTFVFIGAATAMAYVFGLMVMFQIVNRQSENTVRAGEERYRALAENVNDMITRHDVRGRVVFASRAAEQLLGVPVQKVLGDGLFETVHVADRPAYLSALSRCRINNEALALEFRVRRSTNGAGVGASARYGWVEMRCRPVPSRHGRETAGIVAVTRDVSAHKEQEAVLLRARTEAESASHAKTQFLASMSHELRTPLNAIIGFSEILESELFGALGEERYRDYARMIHESGQHLLNVVNDILDMSKIEAGKFSLLKEPLNAAELIESCCDIMQHTAEQKRLSLTAEATQAIPELAADKRACKQMLLNVLSNAIKFTEPGGWVKVSTSIEGGMFAITVADNGIGIADQDLPRLGDPFVQATGFNDRSHEGAGLGLSVVRGLARLHGGRLEIASTLGEGTVVRIALPLECASETNEASDARAASAA